MSSREVKETSLYQLTKKERVIYLAKQDPFLKVEKIAQLAETTSHYVRTVLSEADLSLTKLRENYARKNEVDSYDQNQLVLDLLNLDKLENIKYEVQSDLILNKNYNFDVHCENEFKETLVFKSNGQPIFINSLFLATDHNVDNSKELKKISDLSVSDVEVTLKSCDPKVAELLKSKANNPIIVLEKEIYLNNKFQGINVIYFLANKLKLVLDDVLQEISVIINKE